MRHHKGRMLTVLGGLLVLVIVILIVNDFKDDNVMWGMTPPDFMSFIASVSTVFAVGALVYQIRLQRKEGEAQAANWAYEKLAATEFQEKLRFIFSREPETLIRSKLRAQFSNADEKVKANWAEDVTRMFNMLGYQARTGAISKDLIIAGNWDTIVRCGQKLVPHIQQQRADRQEPSGLPEVSKYKGYFVWLVKECKLYQLRKMGLPKQDRWGEDISLIDLQSLLEEKPLHFLD